MKWIGIISINGINAIHRITDVLFNDIWHSGDIVEYERNTIHTIVYRYIKYSGMATDRSRKY